MANHSIPAPNTRSYDRREVKTLAEQFAADLCRQSGVRFRGIQKGFGKVPAQILFDNSFGSTLCIPVEGATVPAIQEMVAKSNAAWACLGIERLRR